MARSAAAATLVAMLLLAGQAAGHRKLQQSRPSKTIKSLLVLGDSVADAGLPNGLWSYDNATYPYAQFGYYGGRFSNGPVWVEYFTAEHNLTMVDYAVGGATVNLRPQAVPLVAELQKALTYLQNNTLPSPSLGVVSIGANDLIQLNGNPTLAANVTGVLDYANYVITGTADAAAQLLDAGLDNILIFPTFDALKVSPLIGLLNIANAALHQELYNLLYIMNQEMSKAIDRLAGAYPSAKVLYYNIEPELRRIVAHPEKYGLKNANTNCVVFNPPGTGAVTVNGTIQPATLLSTCSDPNTNFFWDVLHPTTAGHRLIANYASRQLRKDRLP